MHNSKYRSLDIRAHVLKNLQAYAAAGVSSLNSKRGARSKALASYQK